MEQKLKNNELLEPTENKVTQKEAEVERLFKGDSKPELIKEDKKASDFIKP
jgi:hypothetical protein